MSKNLSFTKKGPGRLHNPLDPARINRLAGLPGAKLLRKVLDNKLAKGTPR